MKTDVVLIANYWHFEHEKASSRYRTMADILSLHSDFDVEVISSTFRHQTKQQRDLKLIDTVEADYKTTLLYEPDYKKNISLKRIYCHHRLAKNVVAYLKNRKKPDVIICSVPSLAIGSVVTKFAKKYRIPIIIDIQDLWPEAFKMAINIPLVSDVLLAPMMLQANQIYKKADVVMAVSETYVKRGLNSNRKAKGFPLFIGTDSELVRREIAGKSEKKPANEFWIGYIGALGHSYDIRSIIDAISVLNDQGYTNIIFKVMGEGVLADDFKQYANEKNVTCDFMGFLDYGTMMSTLIVCDVAVNPIVGNSVSSIINKVSDYAMAGVPVINTQNSSEYRKLLETYNCGINCTNGDKLSIASGIRRLYEDAQLRCEMSANARKLAAECFDRQKTYPEIVKIIDALGE